MPHKCRLVCNAPGEQVTENVPKLAGTGYKVAVAFLLISKCSFPASLQTCVPFMAAFP